MFVTSWILNTKGVAQVFNPGLLIRAPDLSGHLTATPSETKVIKVEQGQPIQVVMSETKILKVEQGQPIQLVMSEIAPIRCLRMFKAQT